MVEIVRYVLSINLSDQEFLLLGFPKTRTITKKMFYGFFFFLVVTIFAEVIQ